MPQSSGTDDASAKITFDGTLLGLGELLVDKFSHIKPHHKALFISHSHSDHYVGLDSVSVFKQLSASVSKIYCTEETGFLIRRRLETKHSKAKECSLDREIIPEFFHPVQVGSSYSITSEFGTPINFTVLPASHCTGSVMFLFSREGVRTLYTGDFRLSVNEPVHPSITEHPILDLYVDSTFLSDEDWCRSFPSHEESIAVLEEIINGQPDKTFHLEFYEGLEPIIQGLSTLNVPVSASNGVRYLFQDICSVLELFADDARVHAGVFGERNDKDLTRLRERCECCVEDTIVIRMSVQWRSMENLTLMQKTQNSGRINIVFSIHCSYDECRKFIIDVDAKNVFNTVEPSSSRNIKIQHDEKYA